MDCKARQVGHERSQNGGLSQKTFRIVPGENKNIFQGEQQMKIDMLKSLGAVMFAGVIFLAGCNKSDAESSTPGEKTGDTLNTAAKETGKALDTAAKETGKALDTAAKKTGEALDTAKEKTTEAAKDTAEATKDATGKALEESGKALKKTGAAVEETGKDMQK